MNSHLMEMVSREIVKSLPPEQKDIYEYVVGLEEELAQRASTSEEFMALLVKHSPHRRAAAHFNLSFGQLMMTMHEIEDKINMQLENKLTHVTWVELTDSVRARQKRNKVKYFYFSLNESKS
ncbi:hypothetical protein NX029_14325 [Cytobacillus firmus]|uniref:hypothetical protein n=1 Tax=Cytobacillus TaxID=2675230 RepID=UPI002041F653|nr:hypothetical protein [Cytobacillus oceanisediminis]MCM3245878.1 hypothetical protein [Cytobacillus oceanisediminis]MCS0825127.1 hypothetical protein [Cytobacillus firmus]